MTKVGLVFLGCPKNLTDFQVTASYLLEAGYDVGVAPEEADVILVTTCAFIESARQEAAAAIEHAVAVKKDPGTPCRAVIVAGCIPQRYRERVFDQFPDVDGIAGVDDLDCIDSLIEAVLSQDGTYVNGVSKGVSKRVFTAPDPTLLLTKAPFAYLKIAEGCRHACAFCAIPGIRGRLRSRAVSEIVVEAKTLLKAGVKELAVIAQDVTAYGQDFKDGTTLSTLLKKLDALRGDFRMRLLYGHPAGITDELLDTIASSKHILPYFDIPLQHSDPGVLKAMHRLDTVKLVPDMVKRIRAKLPNAVLRTTILVGFPGETRESQEHLLAFLKENRFDHLGCFVFSREEGTAAWSMPKRVSEKTAKKRRDEVMTLQAGINAELQASLIGSEDTVLLTEAPETAQGLWKGVATRQAPDDIDGVTFVSGVPEDAQIGSFVRVRYTGVRDYDLQAEAL